MSESATIVYDVTDQIATITLNRPDRLNALLPDMGPRFAELLRSADADPDVRVIVVTGAGRGFCSGADLGVLMQGADALQGYLSGQDASALPTIAFSLGTPVITAINGPSAGIGFVMALCADLRIAGPSATFSSSFARLGLIAEYGSAWLLPRLIGLPAATELLLSGRTVDATEALSLGLVHQVAEDPVSTAKGIAREWINSCAPTSWAIMKRQLLHAMSQDLDAAVQVSLTEMASSFQRPDLAEALAARAQQRPAQFSSWPS